MRFGITIMLALAVMFLSTAANAGHAASGLNSTGKRPGFMRIYGPTLPPYGYVRYCELNPGKCKTRNRILKRPELTSERPVELDEVNRLVNEAIAPMTDKEIYGVNEYWTLPVDRGDCEDYALLKRQILISRGWPRSSLLMTVVKDETGNGHAVLTIRTAQGDFIADNKTNEILGWHETPYQYVMRQSYLNEQNWMRVGPESGSFTRRKLGSNR